MCDAVKRGDDLHALRATETSASAQTQSSARQRPAPSSEEREVFGGSGFRTPYSPQSRMAMDALQDPQKPNSEVLDSFAPNPKPEARKP